MSTSKENPYVEMMRTLFDNRNNNDWESVISDYYMPPDQSKGKVIKSDKIVDSRFDDIKFTFEEGVLEVQLPGLCLDDIGCSFDVSNSIFTVKPITSGSEEEFYVKCVANENTVKIDVSMKHGLFTAVFHVKDTKDVEIHYSY